MLGARAVPASWAPLEQASDAAADQGAHYEAVSERSLLVQLMRAFLAAPWLHSNADPSRSARAPPVQGWAFPIATERGEEGEEEEMDDAEEEGVYLSRSSSALATQRLERLAARSSGSSGSWGTGVGNGDASAWQDGSAAYDAAADYDPAGNALDATDGSAGDQNTGADWQGGGDDGGGGADEEQGAAYDDDGGGTSLRAADAAEAEQLASASAEADEEAALAAEAAASAPQAIGAVATAGSVAVGIQYLGPRSESGGDADSSGSSSSSSSSSELSNNDSSKGSAAGGGSSHGPFLALCSRSADWLCASGASSRRKSSSFELLPLTRGSLRNSSVTALDSDAMPVHNASSNANSSSGGSSSSTGDAVSPLGAGDWFALRSRYNGKLVQAAPKDDDEAWVLRARGEPQSSSSGGGSLVVSAYELWREERDGLRNLGTGAFINFRGDAEGASGAEVRAHGDTKPRRAALHPTSHTHFVLRRAKSAIRGL